MLTHSLCSLGDFDGVVVRALTWRVSDPSSNPGSIGIVKNISPLVSRV